MGGRILQQCSTFPSFCHPFGVWDALVPQRRGCTPACGLPPLWGLFGSTVLYEFFSPSNLAPPFILSRGNERVAFESELGTYLPIVGYHIFSITNRYPIDTQSIPDPHRDRGSMVGQGRIPSCRYTLETWK